MDQPEGASSKTMGLNDEIFYTTVEAPIESFPRIKFFQSKLKDIFHRFEKIYGPISESLKPQKYKSRCLSDAVSQLIISSPMLFLFGSAHSKIPKADLVKEFRPTKVETHLLHEIPSLDDKEKTHKLFGAICTIRMIETPKGKETLLKLKSCIGVENMLFFADAKNELEKDLVINNLEILRNLLKQKMNVVHQSETDLSTAISNHMEQKFINAFHLFDEYLIEATRKTRYPYGCIFGPKDAKERLTAPIMGFLKTPLTILDLLLTIEPTSSEKMIKMDKVIEIAIVRVTKIVLIREIVSIYELKGVGVTEYLEEIKFDEECMKLLKTGNVVERALPKSDMAIFNLIAQLQSIAEKHSKSNSVAQLLTASRLVDRLYTTYGKRRARATKTSLRKQFEEFSKTIAGDVSNVLLSYFLDICSKLKGIRVKIDLLAHLRQELLRIMEKTIDEKKSVEVMPELQNWKDLLGRIKEVKAVGHMFGKLCVFVKEAETGERASEVQSIVRKCLVDYPGEIFIEVFSDSLYAGADGIESPRKITMGDAFLSADGRRGTIGLFMNKHGSESNDLYFVTSSHIVVKPGDVTTIGPTPIPLGIRAHSLLSDFKLLDISVIKIHPNMRHRCNPFFQDKNETRHCHILDMDSIQSIGVGEHVYKRGSTGVVARGCILSTDFQQIGLHKHNFVVGVPVGVDDEPFAQPGDSGSVVYTETENYEIQYISILMGELNLPATGGSSTFEELKQHFSPLILTSCLSEGLNQIEKMFQCKLTLPKPKAN